jgi:transcriptional regulator with GAF, ATPase, and Fis domain
MIGSSGSMIQEIYKTVASWKFAPTTVLIEGETRTGKGTCGAHDSSATACVHAFVPVDCAAIPFL